MCRKYDDDVCDFRGVGWYVVEGYVIFIILFVLFEVCLLGKIWDSFDILRVKVVDFLMLVWRDCRNGYFLFMMMEFLDKEVELGVLNLFMGCRR